MDQKTRLLNVLRGLSTDRPPFICPGGMMNMAVTELMQNEGCAGPEVHLDPQKMARLTLAANRLAGVENVGIPFCMTVEAEAMGAGIDLGSRENEPSIAVYPMNRVTDLDRLSRLDPSKGRAKVCVEAVQILRKESADIPVFANLSGPISLATSLLEPLTFYRALIKDKKASHLLMNTVVDSVMTFGDALIEAGADVLCVADPSASGELIGKKAFSEFCLPYVNKLLLHFKKSYGIPAIVHICGKIRSLGTALSEIEAESISVDAVVSIGLLKQLAPSKVVMGNISTYMMAKGCPESVFKNGKRCLRSGAEILAPACGMSMATPVENIRSLSNAVSCS